MRAYQKSLKTELQIVEEPVVAEVRPEGFAVRVGHTEVLTAWQSVRVRDGEAHVHFVLPSFSGWPIPKDAFASAEARSEFVQSARRYQAEAHVPVTGGPPTWLA